MRAVGTIPEAEEEFRRHTADELAIRRSMTKVLS